MTDGEPTFYIDATSVQNRRTVNDPEYYKAVPYATTIVNTGYHRIDHHRSGSGDPLCGLVCMQGEESRYLLPVYGQ